MPPERAGEEKRTGSDEKTGDGDESDSSIVTLLCRECSFPHKYLISSFAIRHLMVRDCLLSSNSRLLPISTQWYDGRSDSVMTTGRLSSLFVNSYIPKGTTSTKSGVMKDERETPMRRVRQPIIERRYWAHRLGMERQVKTFYVVRSFPISIISCSTEDEDAPSPLTRPLSTLNLSRRAPGISFVCQED
jgi:hypothetical protein